MGVVKHSPAGAEHHRAMSLDQGPEGGLGGVIAPPQVPLQELTVRQARRRPGIEERPDALGDRPDARFRMSAGLP